MLSRLTLVLALLLSVLAVPAAASAAPAPALSWGAVQTPDPYRGRVTALDCVDLRWCMAVDDSGQAVRYADGHWFAPRRVERVQPYGGFRSISCAARTMCLALDRAGRVTRWNGSTWSPPAAPAAGANLTDVACPSRTTCLAIGDRVARWNGDRWYVTTSVVRSTDENSDLSCPTTAFCMAVVQHGLRDDVYEYRRGSWTHPAHFPAGAGSSVSCTSASFCLALGNYDSVERWNGSGWHRAAGPALNDNSWTVSCTAPDRCEVLAEAVAGVNTQAAEWNGRRWSDARSFGGESLVNAFSCVGRSPVCLAMDEMGGATWFHDHRWGYRRLRDAAWGELTGAACGPTRCLVLDRPGGVTATTDSGWSRPARALPRADVTYHSTFALSCSGSSFCLAGDVSGLTRRWDGHAWTSVATSPLTGGTQLSCTDPHWCAELVDSTGSVAVFDGTRWHSGPSLGTSPQAWTISCGGRGSCVAASNGVVRVLHGGHWSARYRLPGTTTNSVSDVSCPSSSFCMVVADAGNTWRWDGNAWHAVPISGFPDAVSCTSSTFCAELDFDGVQVWDGTSWTPSTTLQQPDGTAYGLIACASPALCVVGSWTGEVRIGRAA